MPLIEVKKSSIDEKEVVRKDTTEELNSLKKELENKEPLTAEDAKNFVKQFNEKKWWAEDKTEEELKKIDEVLSPLFVKIRENPNDYLVKEKDGKYSVKEEAYKSWVNSLPQEDADFLKKYEIE